MKSILFSLFLFFFLLGFNSFAQYKQPEPIGGIEEMINNVVYPISAKEAGIEGKVLVKAIIDESGNVAETEVIKSATEDCDKAAIDAIKKTKFIPAMRDDKPDKAEIVVPAIFKLSRK